MKRTVSIISIIAVLVVIMSIYYSNGGIVTAPHNTNSEFAPNSYNISGNEVFPNISIPTGNLIASQIISLPDIHETGHGWTCTGLAYDAKSDSFLVGDIGKELPESSGFASQIVRMNSDFTTVQGIIPLHNTFPDMSDVQGITVDTSDNTIWFCSTSENLIRHIDASGNSIGSFSVTGSPTGIAYSPLDDSFWVLTYASSKNIKHISKTGQTLEQYTFSYSETLDQCFLDYSKGLLYITAGENYSARNNIYCFNVSTHEQSVVCTVDSYSVEGLWIGEGKMVIVNDGYYHSAAVPNNQANIYTLE